MMFYHSFLQDYYVDIVQKGCSKLKNLGCQVKNLAAVRLREWLEWISNKEAIAIPPDPEQFSILKFVRPCRV